MGCWTPSKRPSGPPDLAKQVERGLHPVTTYAVLLIALAVVPFVRAEDLRNLRPGWEIPTEHYADQPYIVGPTTAHGLHPDDRSGHEGASGQHVVALRSRRPGPDLVAAGRRRAGDGPEASYAVLLKAPSGRVFPSTTTTATTCGASRR